MVGFAASDGRLVRSVTGIVTGCLRGTASVMYALTGRFGTFQSEPDLDVSLGGS